MEWGGEEVGAVSAHPSAVLDGDVADHTAALPAKGNNCTVSARSKLQVQVAGSATCRLDR